MDIPAPAMGPVARSGDWASGLAYNSQGTGGGGYLKESLKIGLRAHYRGQGMDPDNLPPPEPSEYERYQEQQIPPRPQPPMPPTRTLQEHYNPDAWADVTQGIPVRETTTSQSFPADKPQIALGGRLRKKKKKGKADYEYEVVLTQEEAVKQAVLELEEAVTRLRGLFTGLTKRIPEEELEKFRGALSSITESALSRPRPMDAIYLHLHMLLERYQEPLEEDIEHMGPQDDETEQELNVGTDFAPKYAKFMSVIPETEDWIISMVQKQLQAGITPKDICDSAEKLIAAASDGRVRKTWEWTLRALDPLCREV